MTDKRDANGRFQKGHHQRESGIAKETTPPPAKANPRIVLQHGFLRDLAAEWEAHGASAIRIMRVEKPSEFVKVVASLMPRELDIDTERLVINVLKLTDITPGKLIEHDGDDKPSA
jgi:hypothetical protein